MKILVVDDEQDICEILQYNLETEGYEVSTANSAEEVLPLLVNDYDLILLDVMLGEMSGFQLARKLKEDPKTSRIPIIFVTALDGEDDMVKGLNIGADDYISKPLSVKEVKARVKAVLRRTASYRSSFNNNYSYGNEIRFEGIVLQRDVKTALLDGKNLSLTKLEYELLELFITNPNKVFGRNDLLEKCWPQDISVLDRTVDVSITRLRKKIGVYGQYLKTRVGYGYYFDI